MPRPPDFPYLDLRDIRPRGRCDRGGEIRPKDELHKEYIWAGNALVWSGWLVCDEHRDPPHPQDKPLILKPDPVPVRNPRPDIDRDTANRALKDASGAFILGPDGRYILGPPDQNNRVWAIAPRPVAEMHLRASRPPAIMAIGARAAAPAAAVHAFIGQFIVAQIVAIAPKPLAAVVAKRGAQLSVAATAPRPVASGSLIARPTINLAVTTAMPTAAVVAKRGEQLSVAVTAPKPLAAISAVRGARITGMAVTAPKPTAALNLSQGSSISLNVMVTAPKPLATISLKRGEQLSVAATAPKPTAAVSMARGERITAIAVTTTNPTAAVTAKRGEQLSIAVTATKPTAALSLKRGEQLSVAAMAPKPTAALSLKRGEQLSIAATAPKPTAAISANWDPFTYISNIIGRYKPGVASTLYSDTGKTTLQTGTGSTAKVALIADLSGNGLDLVQATSGNQPYRETSQQNSKDCLHFTFGNSTQMRVTNSTLISPLQDTSITALCVVKVTVQAPSASPGMPFSIGAAADTAISTNNFHAETPNNSSLPSHMGVARWYNNTTDAKISQSGYTPPVFVRCVYRFDRTNKILRLNVSGTAYTSSAQTYTSYTSGVNAWDTICMGTLVSNASARYFEGQLYELAIWNTHASDTDVTNLLTYSSNEYGT